MTKKEMAQILAIVKSVYPNTKIDDAAAMVEGWYFVLGDQPAEKILNAARLHMTVSKFFPTPAEILELEVRAELIFGSKPNTKNLESADQEKQIEGPTDDILQICDV